MAVLYKAGIHCFELVSSELLYLTQNPCWTLVDLGLILPPVDPPPTSESRLLRFPLLRARPEKVEVFPIVQPPCLREVLPVSHVTVDLLVLSGESLEPAVVPEEAEDQSVPDRKRVRDRGAAMEAPRMEGLGN